MWFPFLLERQSSNSYYIFVRRVNYSYFKHRSERLTVRYLLASAHVRNHRGKRHSLHHGSRLLGCTSPPNNDPQSSLLQFGRSIESYLEPENTQRMMPRLGLYSTWIAKRGSFLGGKFGEAPQGKDWRACIYFDKKLVWVSHLEKKCTWVRRSVVINVLIFYRPYSRNMVKWIFVIQFQIYQFWVV